MISLNSLLAAIILPVALADILSSHTVAQLQLGAWLENIAIRPNGDVLLSQLYPSAEILTIRNSAESGCHTLEVVASIPVLQNINGITEVAVASGYETYVFTGGNSTSSLVPVVGGFSAWSLTYHGRRGHENVPKIAKISNLNSKSTFLNGVTDVPGALGIVLIADSTLGLVGRLDVATGFFDASAFSFQEMKPVSGATVAIGVNGIHVRDDYLYFSNSYLVSIFRVRISTIGRSVPNATPQLVANLSSIATFIDDFAFDPSGRAIYIATNLDNSVARFDIETARAKIVVGALTESTVAGSTAVAFGRCKNAHTLYVSTSGAPVVPVNGTFSEGGKVVQAEWSGHWR
ncbi:hypothetical protein G7046_g2488 [Stylonectria norvegica]|nr:hypothetical protein G7046_g2488 [Stylonectria norvegica]